VAEDLAGRVLTAAAELGFRRNDIARTLRSSQSSRTIGLLIEEITNPFYSTIASVVADVATAHQTVLVIVSSEEDPASERELLLTCASGGWTGCWSYRPGTTTRTCGPRFRWARRWSSSIGRRGNCFPGRDVRPGRAGPHRGGAAVRRHRRRSVVAVDPDIADESGQTRSYSLTIARQRCQAPHRACGYALPSVMLDIAST
jgi:hypothetical protein